ncbi:type II toxin-antitoxin system death-on-curing family toxin [Levilactobacillus zymae]|uniref:type II toxin-antitoxin system death-on-curing family toxin n=1 Tax=Levilactobacillus zymae TaxID=267363 RepID=UPI0028BC6209|nr:type II toxin-antitoxin system death-on-curing family toxin [Levilactobacillus zymae]MDT6980588.1 type II toxin-antitoxin system death-on-curing family toxin [Levilactobacillus zymae]
MRYLSANELVQLNQKVLSASNQVSQIRNAKGLGSIEALPRQSFFGTEAYPKLSQKLGIVFIKIINLHPFADGNKRTAVLALSVMARLNNYDLTFSIVDLNDFALMVAQLEDGQLDYDQVFQTIATHLKQR